MKVRISKKRLPSMLVLPLLMLAACSSSQQVTPADRLYLFSPGEIDHFPLERYRNELTAEQMPYIFVKTYTEQSGYRGLYGTILIDPAGAEVKYLCLVNILPTVEQARNLFDGMTPEPFPTDFGAEEEIASRLYRADEAYLYRDDMYFHLVLRSSRIVYSILLEGAAVAEPQVRNNLGQKIDYLNRHLDTIR